jgi:divalent metal cation (Fe/Co/Zn/Cd) transporter
MAMLSLDIRRNVLVVITGIVVAYVRLVVQYGHYSWESMGQFLISWFIHYLGAWFIVAISYGVIKATENIFFEYGETEERLSIDQVIVYVSIFVLTISVFIFVIAHWISDDINGLWP